MSTCAACGNAENAPCCEKQQCTSPLVCGKNNYCRAKVPGTGQWAGMQCGDDGSCATSYLTCQGGICACGPGSDFQKCTEQGDKVCDPGGGGGGGVPPDWPSAFNTAYILKPNEANAAKFTGKCTSPESKAWGYAGGCVAGQMGSKASGGSVANCLSPATWSLDTANSYKQYCAAT